MTKKIEFSIIIPIRVENDYLRETLSYLKKQTYKNFETLVITDKISKNSNPAFKRNLGAKMAKGNYLAFLDDDSYPHKNWLKNAKKQFEKQKNITAICGPCLTPPKDNIYQQASGLVWGSFLGSGGAGTYRNKVAKARFVDDFPSVNLIVNKEDFFKVKGFDTHHWPGEDTILCLNLIKKINKKIYYHPSVKVYHHRREVIKKHLQQITRYALHRGLFARIYPENSRKIGYFLPSLFFIYIISLPLTKFYYPLYLYLILLLANLLNYLFTNSLICSLLATITIPITHLYYGILFIKGFFMKNLAFKAHHVNKKTGSYIGG
jgi:cellulose synthase/poly-beta-1,6-N-acetylglucosamine synthase-like glycosyltransferase